MSGIPDTPGRPEIGSGQRGHSHGGGHEHVADHDSDHVDVDTDADADADAGNVTARAAVVQSLSLIHI